MNRCERNNNPLNIIRSAAWQGLVSSEKRTDPRFCEFISPEWGFRAAWCLFRTYLTRRGIENVHELVWRWCPDNTAPNYIKQVVRRSGVKEFEPLHWHKEYYDTLAPIMKAMARVEGYASKTDEQIDQEIKKGWDMLWKQ